MRNVCGGAFKWLQSVYSADLCSLVNRVRNWAPVWAPIAVAFLLTSCGGDLQRFHVLKKQQIVEIESVYELTKHEIVDEGSGITYSGVGPGTFTLQKVTVGGAYLRRTDVTDGVDYDFKGGIHGNPTATQ